MQKRKVKDFALRRFERHFELHATNSEHLHRVYLAALVLTAMAHGFINGFAQNNDDDMTVPSSLWLYDQAQAEKSANLSPSDLVLMEVRESKPQQSWMEDI